MLYFVVWCAPEQIKRDHEWELDGSSVVFGRVLKEKRDVHEKVDDEEEGQNLDREYFWNVKDVDLNDIGTLIYIIYT